MSENHWMLDVLVDLRSFAAANDLVNLADQLEETRKVAPVELGKLDDTAGTLTHGQQNKLEQNSEDPGGHEYT